MKVKIYKRMQRYDEALRDAKTALTLMSDKEKRLKSQEIRQTIQELKVRNKKTDRLSLD